MSSQVPADCRRQFALGFNGNHSSAQVKQLRGLQVWKSDLANGSESERIDQLWLWMAEAQITEHEAWHQTIPFAGRAEGLSRSSSPQSQISNGCSLGS
jgi:hypothetical protein